MKSKTFIVSLVICIAIIGLFAWGYYAKGGTAASVQGVSASDAGTGILTSSETFYDFGTISMKNGNVSKEFGITNLSDRAVTLSKVLTSCMCTSAFIVRSDGSAKGPFGMAGHGGAVPPVNEIIGPGENRVVRVIFDPNAHGPAGVGKIDRFITLTDASGRNLQFEIKANVTP